MRTAKPGKQPSTSYAAWCAWHDAWVEPQKPPFIQALEATHQSLLRLEEAERARCKTAWEQALGTRDHLARSLDLRPSASPLRYQAVQEHNDYCAGLFQEFNAVGATAFLRQDALSRAWSAYKEESFRAHMAAFPTPSTPPKRLP